MTLEDLSDHPFRGDVKQPVINTPLPVNEYAEQRNAELDQRMYGKEVNQRFIESEDALRESGGYNFIFDGYTPKFKQFDRGMHGENRFTTWLYEGAWKITDGVIGGLEKPDYVPDYSDWMTPELDQEILKYNEEQQDTMYAAVNPQQVRDIMREIKFHEDNQAMIAEVFHGHRMKNSDDTFKNVSFTAGDLLSPFQSAQLLTAKHLPEVTQQGMAVGEYLSHATDPAVMAAYLAGGMIGHRAATALGGFNSAKAAATFNAAKDTQALISETALAAHRNLRMAQSAGIGAVADTTAALIYTTLAKRGRHLSDSEVFSHVGGAAFFGAAFGGRSGWLRGKSYSRQLVELQAYRMDSADKMIAALGDQFLPVVQAAIKHGVGSPEFTRLKRTLELTAQGREVRPGKVRGAARQGRRIEAQGKGGQPKELDAPTMPTAKKAAEALAELKRMERLDVATNEVWTAIQNKQFDRARDIIHENQELFKYADPKTATMSSVVLESRLNSHPEAAAAWKKIFDNDVPELTTGEIDYLLTAHPDVLAEIAATATKVRGPDGRFRTEVNGLHRIAVLTRSPERMAQIQAQIQAAQQGAKVGRKILKGVTHQVGDQVKLSNGKVGKVVSKTKAGKMLTVDVNGKQVRVGAKSVEQVSVAEQVARETVDVSKWTTDPDGKQTVGSKTQYEVDSKGNRIRDKDGNFVPELEFGQVAVWRTKSGKVVEPTPENLKDPKWRKKHDMTMEEDQIAVEVGGRTFNTKFDATIDGQDVTINRELNGSTNPKDHEWTVTVKDPKTGKGIEIKTEAEWQRGLEEGMYLPTDYVYLNRRSVKSTTAKGIKDEVAKMIEDDVIALREEAILANKQRENINLFPEDAPRDILAMLAEGRIPAELRELFPQIDQQVLANWAKEQLIKMDAGEIPRTEGPQNVLDRIEKNQQFPARPTEGAQREADAMDIDNVDAPILDKVMRFWTSFNMGYSHRLMSDPVPAVRKLAADIFGSEVALRNAAGELVPANDAAGILGGGALTARHDITSANLAAFSRIHTAGRKAYTKEGGWSIWKQREGHKEFDTVIKRYIEAHNPDIDITPEQVLIDQFGKDFATTAKGRVKALKDSKDVYAKTTKKIIEDAKSLGVKELDNIEWADWYYPRIKNATKFEAVLSLENKPLLVKQIRESIKRGSDKDIAPEFLDFMSQKLFDHYTSSKASTPSMLDDILGAKAETAAQFPDMFERLINRGLGDKNQIKLTPKERQDLIKWVQSEVKAQRGTSRAMKRIRMDMGVKSKYKIDGVEHTFYMSDFFESNMAHVLQRYSLDLVTRAQEVALLKKYTTDTYKPDSIEMLVKHIDDLTKNTHGIYSKLREDDLRLLQKFFNNEPKFDRTRLGALGLVAKQAATNLKLASFTGAQVPEAWLATVSTGLWRTMIERIPALRKLQGAAQYGRLDKKTAVDLTELEYGFGRVEHDLRALYDRTELIYEGNPMEGDYFAARFYQYLSRGASPIGKYSGYYAMNIYSDRVAVRNFTTQLARIVKQGNRNAKGREILGPKRITQLGVTQTEFKSVIKALNKKGVLIYENIGGKDTGLFSVDLELMPAYERGLLRTMQAKNIRQVVQRSNPWNSHYAVITSEVGELLAQFRSFGWSSQANHFARNLQARDALAASNITNMLFAGAVTHIAKAYLNFGDRPDKLEEMLSWSSILRGAITRGSALGIMPDLVDIPYYILTGETFVSPWNEPALMTPATVTMGSDIRQAATAMSSLVGIAEHDPYALQKINRINPARGAYFVDALFGTYKAINQKPLIDTINP